MNALLSSCTPLVASASYPNALTLFDIREGEQVWQTKCVSPPTRIAFSPDGNTIGVASMIGRAMLYDADNGQLIAGIKQNLPAGNGVAFSPDGKYIYIGATQMSGKPGQTRIVRCSAETGHVITEFGGYEGTLTRLRISPSGRRLVSLDRNGALKVWDTRSDRLAQSWKLDVKKLMQVWFLDDDMLVAGSLDQFQFLKVGQPDPIQVVAQGGGVSHVAPLPTRGLLVAGVDKSVHLFAFDKAVLNPVVAVAKPDAPAAMPKTRNNGAQLTNTRSF